MDETVITLGSKIKAALLCVIVFNVVYFGCTWYTTSLPYVPSFVFSFEKYIPFLAWTIVPYATSSWIFCSLCFFCKTKEQLSNLVKRILFIVVIAGLSYIFFPLKFSLIRPETGNILFEFLFQMLEKVDSPFNQAPSLHVAFAFVFWSVFKKFKTEWRYLLGVWCLLLMLSTLTTYHHHLIDIVLGAILAQFSFVVFPLHKKSFQSRNLHIANYYFLTGWVMVLMSLCLYEFYSVFYAILLWPSLVLFLIGIAYETNNVNYLKDNSGNTSWYKKVIYLPHLMMYWFFWRFLRKNTKPIEVIDKIHLSSRLGKVEIEKFKFDKNTLVYDFSAELEEPKQIKEKAQYFANPLLDVGAFDEQKIKRIVLEISEKYKNLPEDGKILIHCTMGFTRSTFMGVLVVKNILSLPLEGVMKVIKKRHKNAVLHKYLQDFLKTFNI